MGFIDFMIEVVKWTGLFFIGVFLILIGLSVVFSSLGHTFGTIFGVIVMCVGGLVVMYARASSKHIRDQLY